MTYQEKGAWLMLAILSLVYGIYAWQIYQMGGLDQVPRPLAWIAILATTIVLAVSLTLGHILLAIFGPKNAMEPEDERIKLINLRAEKIGSMALGACMVFIMLVSMARGDVLMAHMALASLIICELVTHICVVTFFRIQS